jgi:hypothetical protein
LDEAAVATAMHDTADQQRNDSPRKDAILPTVLAAEHIPKFLYHQGGRGHFDFEQAPTVI